MQSDEIASRTIADFGEQWMRYRNNPGYYGSVELLADFFGPLLELDTVRDRRVADIGSGTGRIVNMLLDAGASHVHAVEPSKAYFVLLENTATRRERVTCMRARGESLPPDLELDLVVSMGVLHHIPEPSAVVAAAHRALRPGGQMVVWLYGREGNELYLRVVEPLRRVASRMPHRLLEFVCSGLNVALDVYIFLCRHLPLPMRRYMNDVLGRLPRQVRRLTIYDQLNPAYARYYAQDEARRLLEDVGFVDVRTWHRHGYSWSVVGTRPATDAATGMPTGLSSR